MIHDEKKLDNPVWYSLSETHKKKALDFGEMKFYDPDYCSFGGFTEVENTATALAEYSKLTNSFFIFGAKPILPNSLKLKNELVCLQMIIDSKIKENFRDEIVALNEAHLDDLLRLVKIVYPEYFKQKTASLGDYFGIYKNNQLVAITGERMRMDGFIEVSAVITHPDHTGKGYAKQLVTHVVNAIFDKNNTPFLHVSEANFGAIKLYEKLGFRTRRKISIWNITKND
jgi:GNAT superfamily N-acetyltransferase